MNRAYEIVQCAGVDAAAAANVPTKRRVLLVDDNPLQLASLRLHLEKEGYAVSTATSASQALEIVRREGTDLVLSDILMPGTDGFELCRELRRMSGMDVVPVALVSGLYGDALDIRHAAQCGANMFFARSEGAATIAQGLRQLLQRPGARLDPAQDGTLDAEHGRRMARQLEKLSAAHDTVTHKLEVQERFLAEIGGVAERTAGQDDPRDFADHFVRAGLEHVLVYRRDADGRLRLAERAGCPNLLEPAARLFGERAFFEQRAAGLEPLLLPNAAAPAGVMAALRAQGFVSAALLPLACRAEHFGLVMILSTAPDFGGSEAVIFARAVASQIGGILHVGRSRREIRESREELRAVLNGIADGVFSTDGRFIVLDANPAMSEIAGYSIDDARGRPLLDFVAPHAHERLLEQVPDYVATGRFEADVPFLRADGSERIARITGRRVHDDLFVNIVRDVTEKQRYETELQRLAHTDVLTGLVNRTAFLQRLELAGTAAAGGGHAAGVLVLSLGNFREINDTLGPDGGDQVLREAAQRLVEAADGSEITTARLGAAQFGILLPGLARRAELERHAHVVMAMLAAPLTVDGIPVEVMPCIGSALCPEDALLAGDLLRRASVAMHHARAHHMTYVHYSPEHDPFSLKQLMLVSELRQAIARNQLELWYQPKLALKSGRVDAVEALVRWRHPDRGLIPPDEFIPAAERTGLVHLLTAWVVKTALAQAQRWHEQGLRLNVAINISQNDLREDSFPTHVLHVLKTTGLAPSSITLEITETAAMHDPKLAAATLGELRQHGLRISLDDFGIGRASLAHLHHLPVDEIKLDKSFVMNLPDSHSRSIANATAMIAREFGLKSVAEGAETADSQHLLGELGFDRVQGYHLSRPLPAAEFEAWLLRRQPTLPVAAAA